MGFMWVLKDYIMERIGNAMQNTTVFGMIRFMEMCFQFFIIVFMAQDGKLSIFNRTFTGFITIFFGWIVIIL